MSEKSKGDTSRIVNNPLLSASVTGLTFDDFPSAPLLLPAAPPIERSPPPVLDLNTDAKESAPGQSLNTDSDVFSEINLNATVDEEEYSHQPSSASFISPLEESPAVADTSLLSQAASSFSQLPSVASTVFSTFSKVIKDYTPTGQENNDDSVGVPGGGAIVEPPAALATYDNFYTSERYDSNSNSNLNPPQADQPPPEPPKFYSPTEFTTQPPTANTPGGNQNTYRLSAKKKTYAHIPGLSSNSHPAISPIVPAATPPQPGPTPPPQQSLPFQPPQSYEHSSFPPAIAGAEQNQPFLNSGPVFNLQSTTADIQPFINTAPQAASSATKEERRSLFSFSNVVTPVWQNLSGLVGKGSSQERETSVNSPSSGIDIGGSNEQRQNFAYAASPFSTGQYFSNPTSQLESVAQPTEVSVLAPPPSTFTPGYQQTALSQPQHLGAPPVSSFTVSTQESVQPVPASVFFGTPNSSASALAPAQFLPSVPQVSATPPAVPLVNPYGPINPPLAAPTGFIQPPSSHTPPIVASTAESNNPPLAQGPPKAGAGNTFRLQKGTRHYRAPLDIATNPAVSSNFLQTNNEHNFQPNPSLAFTPFNPVVASQPQVYSPVPQIYGVSEQHGPQPPKSISSQPQIKQDPQGPLPSNSKGPQALQPLEPPPSQSQALLDSQLQGPPKAQGSLPELQATSTPPLPQVEQGPVVSQPQGIQVPKPVGPPPSQSQELPASQLQVTNVPPLQASTQVLPPQGLAPTQLQDSLPSPPKPQTTPTPSELQGPQKAPILHQTHEQSPVSLFNPQSLTFNQPTTEATPPLFSVFGKVEHTTVNPPSAPPLQQTPLFNPFGLQAEPNSVTGLFSNTQPLQSFFTQQPAFNPFVPTPSGQNVFQAVIPQPIREPSNDSTSNVNTKNQSVTASFAPNPEIGSAPATSEESVINKEGESEISGIESSKVPPADFDPPAEIVKDTHTAPSIQQYGSSEEKQYPATPAVTAPAVSFLPDAFGNLQLETKPLELQPAIPQQAEPIQPAAQPFTLTNYFASQAFEQQQQTQFDLNANKPTSEPTALQPSRKSSSQSSYQPEPVNFFSQVYKVDDNRNATVPSLPDPISFFDSFQQESAATSSTPLPRAASTGDLEDELNSNFTSDTRSEPTENSFQIQNFFNNPPQNLNQSEAELNYKLVGSNLAKNRYADTLNRAISPQSNVVEPPSSACSEFSTEASYQNTSNLSKLTNVDDIPDYLKAEYIESLDPEIMALLVNTKATTAGAVYQPAVKHWFYKKKVDDKYIWTPFSHRDSNVIEAHFSDPTVPKIVAVEGGRYDVNIDERQRIPIYWSGEATEVRRCSWFYKGVDSRYVPYEESIADKLESEYEEAFSTGEWHRKIPLPTGETVVFHGATVLVHFLQTQSSDSWGASQTISRSRVVKRDLEDFTIEPDESNKVDHLLFMVHGIGSVCDLKFRTVEEVVDEFRSIATQLIQSHYKNPTESGRIGRVEILPISWHSELHSEESGIDEKLKAITLESMPKLRNFANDTLLDILFYTSPIFCQNIMDTVGGTMNKVYLKYCQRNPQFNGGVSLAGHSLGSLILFDLLSHQKPIENTFVQNSENPDQPITPIQIRAPDDGAADVTTDNQINYTIGPAGTGQAFISYPQLVFQPKKFFALGSPIGMFVTIRGIDKLGLDFKLPTCTGFFNIFHPYDPVAYRIEALVNRDLSTVRPVVVPHHKGRKRMHLELRETMTRVGADIKQKIVDAFKNTMDTVYQLTAKQKASHDPKEIEKEVDKVLEEQLKLDKEPRSRTDSVSTQSDIDAGEIDLPLGNLNEGRRIDHVLQEAPLEFINEYLFALTSHVCYWESADTILFIMKEIYSSLGVQSDSQVPQQSMTIERPQSNSFSSSFDTSPIVEQ